MNVIENVGFRVSEAQRVEQAVLYGEVREDLIRDEVLPQIFAATVRARPDHLAMIFDS